MGNMHAKFQPSGFTCMGGEGGDGQTLDVMLYHLTSSLRFTCSVKIAGRARFEITTLDLSSNKVTLSTHL